jgi:hypothetical protein
MFACAQCLWRAFDKNRLKVAAGGCGGRGLTADANLMALGIESFFVCNLFDFAWLRKTREKRKSQLRVLPCGMT